MTREDITKHGFTETLADLMLKQIEFFSAIREPDGEQRELEFRGVEEAIKAMLRAQYPLNPGKFRWVVRICVNWKCHPFRYKTFGVTATEEAAIFLRAYCGSYIHTEVSIVKIRKGVDAFADHIADCECM